MEKIYPGTSMYNIGGPIKMRGTVDLEVLELAIFRFIRSHEGIRLYFMEKEGEPVQYVGEFPREKLDFFDFSAGENPEALFLEWVGKEAETPFVLENTPLFYFALFRISDRLAGYFVKFHHMIADGWSVNIMTDEIREIYMELVSGKDDRKPEKESYLKFLDTEKEYLASRRYWKDRAFWMEQYGDLSGLPLHAYSEGIRGRRQTFRLDQTLSERIKQFAAEKKFSLNTFFVAVYLIYSYKTSREKELVIGTPVLNRSGAAEKRMFGMFTSSMPFRYEVKEHFTAAETMKDVNDGLMTCYFHQKYPYNMLVQDLELKKRGFDNLFNTCINYYNTRLATELDGAVLENIELYSGFQVYSLQIVIKNWLDTGELTLDFDYKTGEYSERKIQAVYEGMLSLIGNILDKPEELISGIWTVSPETGRRLVYGFNATEADYPRDKPIHRLFEEQAARTPEKTALCFENRTMTYRELNERANRLARRLKQMGVGRETITGLLTTHSMETVVAILAVLKAGGAYLPIDAETPPERIGFMLDDSGAVLLLTNREPDARLSFRGEILRLDDGSLYSGNGDNPAIGVRPDDLAYVIYTSGSTGQPKGTMVEHRGLVNYIWWAAKMYVKSREEVFALYSSLAFDLTVTSIFTPLVTGSTMLIYEDNGDEYVLFRILKENKATAVKLTPSHLSPLKELDNGKSSVKRFIVGGEDLKVSLAQKIHHSFHGKVEIFNEYGPTETVVGCMIHRYNEREDTGTSVPIGVPADNVQIYVLDGDLGPAAAGMPGELYVSGDGVARGYLNNPGLTEEKFIENPFLQGKRMYRTGDMARFLDNGKIEYLGRKDEQVKIRGYRVEPGEIEKHLTSHKAVRDAVVAEKKNDEGAGQLCAYIVKETEFPLETLRDYLAEFLPDYMIPGFFMELEAIPLNRNGKVDRALLPPPERKSTQKEAPLPDKTQEALAAVMEEVLGISGIGPEDNFYSLGGDSIKAIQMASRLNSRGLKVKVRDILTHPVIREMAPCIRREKREAEASVACRGVVGPTPIVAWFLSQGFQKPGFYNQSVLLELVRPIGAGHLEEALRALVRRHDSLRMNCRMETGELFYNDAHIDQPISVKEYRLEGTEEKWRGGLEQLCESIKSGFDPERSLLFSASLIHLGEKGRRLLLTAHHLVVDGISWRILLEDLYTALQQLYNGKQACLPPGTDSYRKWAELVRTYDKQAGGEIGYWRSLSEFDAGFDFYHAFCHKKGTGQGIASLQISLNTEDTSLLLNAANKAYNTEPVHLLLTALAMSLRALTGKERMAVELESHGREELGEDLDITETVGWFTSIYPVVLSLEGTELREHIKTVKEQVRSVPANGIGYGILNYLTGALENRQKYVRFNYLGEFSHARYGDIFRLSGDSHGRESSGDNHLTSLLDIDCLTADGIFSARFTYEPDAIEEDAVHTLSAAFTENLKTILRHCAGRKETDFTPSDFDTVNLLQSELDQLFR